MPGTKFHIRWCDCLYVAVELLAEMTELNVGTLLAFLWTCWLWHYRNRREATTDKPFVGKCIVELIKEWSFALAGAGFVRMPERFIGKAFPRESVKFRKCTFVGVVIVSLKWGDGETSFKLVEETVTRMSLPEQANELTNAIHLKATNARLQPRA